MEVAQSRMLEYSAEARGLDAGSYRVGFDDHGGHAREFYDDEPALDVSDPVTVGASNDSLDPIVSGTVPMIVS